MSEDTVAFSGRDTGEVCHCTNRILCDYSRRPVVRRVDSMMVVNPTPITSIKITISMYCEVCASSYKPDGKRFEKFLSILGEEEQERESQREKEEKKRVGLR